MKGGGVHDGFSSDGSFGDILKDDRSVQSENLTLVLTSQLGTLETFLMSAKNELVSRRDARARGICQATL